MSIPPSVGIGAMVANEIDDDSADVWITRPPFSKSNALHRGLYTLEQQLRCDVCQDLFKVPVTLRCGHTYCNHCIQKHAEQVKQSTKRAPDCPQCRRHFSDSDLKPNSALEQVKFSYQAIRSQLMQALQVSANLQANDSEPLEAADDNNNQQRATRKRTLIDYNDSTGTESSSDSTGRGEVLRDIDGNQKQSWPTMTKRAKTSYNSLKKKQLKELCETEGLPTTGSDEELKARHRDFIRLYNVECDSTRPRSKRELLQVFMKQEQTEKMEARKVANETKSLKTLLSKLGSCDRAEGAALCSGNQVLDQKMKGNFDKMIAEMRSRRGPTSSAAKKHKNTSPRTIARVAQKEPHSSSQTETSPLLSKDGTGATTPEDLLGLGSQGPSPISHHCSQSTVGVSQPSELVERLVTNSGRGFSQSPYAAHTSGAGYNVEPTEEVALQQARRNVNAKTSAVSDAAASNDRATAESMQPQPVSSIAKKHTKPPIAPHQSQSTGKASTKICTGSKKPRKPTRTTRAELAGSRRACRSIVGPWVCHVCTFYNVERTYSTAKCAMCETQRRRETVSHARDDNTVSFL
jgi:zinc finger of C3HC4-type, RING/SAP domain